jgi:hypothetical protein
MGCNQITKGKDQGASAPFFMEIIEKVCKGNKAAAEFLNAIWQISGVWDDLVDRDKPVANKDIDQAFWLALVGLPRNEFYQLNFNLLNPLLINSITNWKCANVFECTTDDYKLSIAFVLRSSYVDLLTMTALIIGGREWADEMVQEIRLYSHSEKLDGYKNNLATQKKESSK